MWAMPRSPSISSFNIAIRYLLDMVEQVIVLWGAIVVLAIMLLMMSFALRCFLAWQ